MIEEASCTHSERMARARETAEAGDGELTFAPAINDNSLRLALAKELRELRDHQPACARLMGSAAPDRAPSRAAQGRVSGSPRIRLMLDADESMPIP